jgi:phosphate transport system substrate-binding protein
MVRKLFANFAMVSLLSIAHHASAVAEPIVIIVNKANEVSALTKEEINNIYRGKVQKWPSGEKIKVVNLAINLSAKDDVRINFYKKILNESPNKKFYISGSPKPFRTSVRKTAKSVLHFVSRFKGGLGYVPASEVDDKVKVVYTIN